MLVADILRLKGAVVESIPAESTVQYALETLARLRIGALLISADKKSIDGILSERDIVRLLARGPADLAVTPVSSVMVTDVFTCGPDASLAQVMALMTERRIRHVPVVTESGELSGVVSIGDVVNARLSEAETERQQMADYIADRATY